VFKIVVGSIKIAVILSAIIVSDEAVFYIQIWLFFVKKLCEKTGADSDQV
jgi:hypothetical protein